MGAASGEFMPDPGGEYGMAILSRYPGVGQASSRLPEGNEPCVALRADVLLPNGDTIAVVNVQFDWAANDSVRVAQATMLAGVLDTPSRPIILLDDFNDEPGSPPWQSSRRVRRRPGSRSVTT